MLDPQRIQVIINTQFFESLAIVGDARLALLLVFTQPHVPDVKMTSHHARTSFSSIRSINMCKCADKCARSVHDCSAEDRCFQGCKIVL